MSKFTCPTCSGEKQGTSLGYYQRVIDGQVVLFCSYDCAKEFKSNMEFQHKLDKDVLTKEYKYEPLPPRGTFSPLKPLTRTDVFWAIIQAWVVITAMKFVADLTHLAIMAVAR